MPLCPCGDVVLRLQRNKQEGFPLSVIVQDGKASSSLSDSTVYSYGDFTTVAQYCENLFSNKRKSMDWRHSLALKMDSLFMCSLS